jgi:hypothetical protein
MGRKTNTFWEDCSSSSSGIVVLSVVGLGVAMRVYRGVVKFEEINTIPPYYHYTLLATSTVPGVVPVLYWGALTDTPWEGAWFLGFLVFQEFRYPGFLGVQVAW